MDVSNGSLLHRLIDSPGNEDETKADFKTAMQRMGFESVFDIVRMTKEEFTLELARHTDANAEQAYGNALSYARQISRLYQEHQLSSGDASRRVRRSVGTESTSGPATYQALFNENWEQFCKDGDIAAIDSPVAYLRALYLFAGQLEKSSTHPDKITLEKRRPDLKNLTLDHQSAFAAKPMLSIVNDTLSSHVQEHLKKTNNTKSVHEVLACERYPLSLPYDLHHHQCLLGLGADKPALGELNYQVSLKLPFLLDESEYGSISKPSSEAQRLMSGLSPEQQKILIEPLDPDIEVKAYGTKVSDPRLSVERFKELTGLTMEQIDQLLAQGKHRPKASTNSPGAGRHFYGCEYINTASARDKIMVVATSPATFNILPVICFDVLLRMVRLQRWTGIPAAELDTLIVNAMHSDGTTSLPGLKSLWLNPNTLRVLGVYRYLNQRYGIAPEEFASLLHDMPTSACGDRAPLFDQVFNRTQLLPNPLLQNAGQDIDIKAPKSQPSLNYLGAGLGLTVTQDSLLLLAAQTKEHLSSLKHDLPTVSSLYRQARIAQMFGLSPVECTEMARTLGGEAFCELLAKGKLSDPYNHSSDILDVLMAMEWAVDWLKQNNRDVLQWCRLFSSTKDDLPFPPELERRLETFRADTTPSADHQQRLVETLLHDIADLSAEYVPSVMAMGDTSTMAVVTEIKNFSPGKIPQSLAKVLRAAGACKGLHLNSSTLQQLMSNPAWLASNSPGTLTPQTLYLLERFSHCARHQPQSEENLLHYLRLANEAPAKDSNGLLANLLNWSIEEVSCLTALLGQNRARTMEEVDWIMRCQTCCKRTGLSASLLLNATALTADSSTSDWKTVGEAVLAARH
ncbi:toxin [Pseudomonas sp. FW306-02-F02-AA]|uniref:Toxin n=1 Tax=Pseudomonas fluorescens TaxID=294 RepID=A0A0N9WEG0_PSEFL|nr:MULTISPECIES: Tc toxin subunit A [Pseudomonas]ALI00597.1 toxin [Pseudomonas fluorescens]PMZ01997.1 toxin [Pseudomonas sp. FW306-02-F02-AB]PMZ12978.1 toxin [Pseudomonas sp. FW306-02-F02-AA]PMZ19760.1 toxin [Pseudomonas sp. FW306-02-F08-AA]PMZ24689.1 toxin [Pseudomonas sp. FW306-02-F04-BA]